MTKKELEAEVERLKLLVERLKAELERTKSDRDIWYRIYHGEQKKER